jgi:hypothetical protein
MILAIVLSVAFSIICKRDNLVEGLENQEDLKEEGEDDLEKDLEEDVAEVIEDVKEVIEDKDVKGKNHLDTLDDASSSSEPFSDNFIDYNQTMRNNLKKIDTKNIEKMTNETRDLLKTQQELMETMKQMAPLLKQGMNMVDMFKKKEK